MSTQQGQPVSNLIRVSILLGSAPAQGENVDTMLIVGSTPNVIDPLTRMRTYLTLDEIANDYGTTAPEYLAGQVWFAQRPQPLSVNIGLWAKHGASAQLICASLSAAQQTIALWTAVSSGAFEIALDGTPASVTGLDFSAATNLNGVASIIQTALEALSITGTTVVFNGVNKNFVITSGDQGASSTITFLNPPTAHGSFVFTGQPANLDTITLNGTAVTFVTGAPTGNQVKVGVDLNSTIQALLVFLNTSTDTQLQKFSYSAPTGANVLYAIAGVTGSAGNALTIAKSSTNITVSGTTLSGGTGTDISGMMAGTSTSSGAYVAQGYGPETALAAVQALDNMYSNQWYGLALLGGTNADYLAVAGYIESATVKHAFTVTDQEAAVLISTDTASLMYQLNQLNYNKTCCQYSSSSPYAGISYLARILTTNWNGNNTAITLMYKTEPGIVGESLSTTQLNNILAKKGNVYINYNNGTTIIQGAFQCSGQYTDTIIGADWFALRLMTDLFNELYVTPTKIPQTDAGMNLLHAVIEADCAAATNNGLFAPGTWTLPGFGAIVEGQYLPKGYYIFQPAVATQSPADRQLRKSVPFQIAGKLGGAVHEADLSVTINQ